MTLLVMKLVETASNMTLLVMKLVNCKPMMTVQCAQSPVKKFN